MSEIELVERVARRLADVHFRRKMHYGTGTQDERVASLVEAYWRNHVSDARAAIAEMREPTRHMVESGDAFQTTLAAWRVMIDEALR